VAFRQEPDCVAGRSSGPRGMLTSSRSVRPRSAEKTARAGIRPMTDLLGLKDPASCRVGRLVAELDGLLGGDRRLRESRRAAASDGKTEPYGRTGDGPRRDRSTPPGNLSVGRMVAAELKRSGSDCDVRLHQARGYQAWAQRNLGSFRANAPRGMHRRAREGGIGMATSAGPRVERGGSPSESESLWGSSGLGPR